MAPLQTITETLISEVEGNYFTFCVIIVGTCLWNSNYYLYTAHLWLLDNISNNFFFIIKLHVPFHSLVIFCWWKFTISMHEWFKLDILLCVIPVLWEYFYHRSQLYVVVYGFLLKLLWIIYHPTATLLLFLLFL